MMIMIIILKSSNVKNIETAEKDETPMYSCLVIFCEHCKLFTKGCGVVISEIMTKIVIAIILNVIIICHQGRKMKAM